MSSRRSRSERGAVAVVFGIIVTLMFGMAAIGVDLGNAMTRKKQTQTQADFAALAGAVGLPAENLTPDNDDKAVLDVAEYFIKNKVYDDDTTANYIPNYQLTDTKVSLETKKTLLAPHLVSGNADDIKNYGQVYYGWYDASGTFHPDVQYVTVRAPGVRVSFGLASALGFSNTVVRSRATAAVRSPGSVPGTLPFYAYTGCDWGSQVISHGTENSVEPEIAFDTETNKATLLPGTTPNLSPSQVNVGDVTTSLTLYGSGFAKINPGNAEEGVVAVGFFKDDGSAPTTLATTAFQGLAPNTVQQEAAAGRIHFNLSTVPDVANAAQTTFYIRVQQRVYDGSGNVTQPGNYELKWSAVTSDMAYLIVGEAKLYCNDDKSAGNFGSLTILRTDSSNNANDGWLPLNIALGIDIPKVNLEFYPAAEHPINADTCDDNKDPVAIVSDTESAEINCLLTDTGFPQNPATSGLITGVPTSPTTPGRLTNVASGCGAGNGKPSTRTNVIGKTINNDLLSCFFTSTDPSVARVGLVSSPTYSGGAVISSAIYSSPRFFYIPVINEQPANGKKAFPIVGFRPAYLTGENELAYKGHPMTNAYFYDDGDENVAPPVANGLRISKNNKMLEAFRVVLLNEQAMPPRGDTSGNPIPYDPSLPPIYVLVN